MSPATPHSTPDGLDRIDLRILDVLQRDGRISNLKLAEAVALSPTAVLARVQRLTREGYILGYEARLNPIKLGAGMLVFVEVLLDRTVHETVLRYAEAGQPVSGHIETVDLAVPDLLVQRFIEVWSNIPRLYVIIFLSAVLAQAPAPMVAVIDISPEDDIASIKRKAYGLVHVLLRAHAYRAARPGHQFDAGRRQQRPQFLELLGVVGRQHHPQHRQSPRARFCACTRSTMP